ncbi:hypothetical protein FV232_13345 [Methylobacterium sp. WL30]|uniref:hypothetical protein n=1 Tax=unclassified Methylobacterium TaxID=2615210 RepID=UPI0011CBEA94|nr:MULTISPECIES: hypothetical protein [unclassified Methylobacterium]TXN41463.1 hypothetical protein FV225_02310 [Methylobacterium sp. WL93]TXN50559.1 hypothetical protein FV227_11425 [Methylobacterium sp. WL119]TXN67021.1 hypothetical protein FV232_13345 [Methylobacterium sp. WL30]
MHLPLDMRATLLAASLDVMAEEIEAVRRGRPVSPTLEGVLAEAQASARILAEELHPAQAVAVGEPRRPAIVPATQAPVREVSGNVVQLRPRRT